MKHVRFFLILACLVAFSFTGCHKSDIHPLPGSAHSTYSITDLGVGIPHDINNRGQVVGMYAAGVFPKSNGFPYFHGCLWDNGKRIEMPTLGGWYSDAGRITDTGHILGSASVPGKTPKGLPLEHLGLWDGHKLIDLDADPRFHGTSAVHITKSGAIYAASPPQGPKNQIHLWLYPSGFDPGIRRDVGVIGGPKIKPLFINDSGMVVGTWDAAGERHAFVWHRGDKQWQDIETFGGLWRRGSDPTGLNNSGQIIGVAGLPDDPASPRARVHAFLWQNGRMKDLGTLPGGDFSWPNAINNHGQIVGFSHVNSRSLESRPVLWEHGQIKDLTKLIPIGTQWISMDGAAAINEQGQFVGDGIVAGDELKKGTYRNHAYLLTPR